MMFFLSYGDEKTSAHCDNSFDIMVSITERGFTHVGILNPKTDVDVEINILC